MITKNSIQNWLQIKIYDILENNILFVTRKLLIKSVLSTNYFTAITCSNFLDKCVSS